MDNFSLNRYGMLNAVIAVLLKWIAVVQEFPVISEYLEVLQTNKADIKKTSKELKNARKGKVAEKNSKLLAAINMVLPVKGLLVSAANKTGDLVLLAKVKVSPSELKTKMREDECVEKLQLIMDEARSHPEVMAGGNITTAKLDGIQAAVDGVEIAKGNVSIGSTSASSLLQKEEELVRKTTKYMTDEGDELMLVIMADHADFYNEYIAAREIKDLGGRQKQPADEDVETPVPPAQ